MGWYNLEVFDNYSNNWLNKDSVIYIDFKPQIISCSPNYGNQGFSQSVSIQVKNINPSGDFRLTQSSSNIFNYVADSVVGDFLYSNVSIFPTQNIGWYNLEVYDLNTNNWVGMILHL